MAKEKANNAIDVMIVTIFLKTPEEIAMKLINGSG